MKIKTKKPENEYLGCWNAYVAAGKTKEERNKRLSEAPERHRDNIIKHVTTVFKLRDRK